MAKNNLRMRCTHLLFVVLLLLACQQQKVQDTVTEVQVEKKEKKQEPVFDFISLEYIMGKFDPSKDKGFVAIPLKYSDREGMYMRKEAMKAFEEMNEAALKDGVKLVIRSAARNFDYQKGIWEKKWTGATKLSDGTNVATDIPSAKAKALKILEYSSMPGSSRHHWGTDIDFNSFENSWFESGEGLKLFNWLEANASKYGFGRPYSKKGSDRPHGYNEEKWHWSYLPIANSLTAFAERQLKNEMIQGFQGAETASEIDIVSKYVLGIHSSCKK